MVTYMAYMTEKEFSQKLERIQIENEQREKLRQLKKERWKHIFNFKLPSTSKLILFAVFFMCIEILIFSQYAMIKFGDLAAMYTLIGVPVALIPTVWKYMDKSKAENTVGGITFETAMHELNKTNFDSTNEFNNPVG